MGGGLHRRHSVACVKGAGPRGPGGHLLPREHEARETGCVQSWRVLAVAAEYTHVREQEKEKTRRGEGRRDVPGGRMWTSPRTD